VQNHRRLQNFLAAVAQEEVISLEHPAAVLAGRISGDLDRTGQTIGKADPMIAAIALHHGLELVTGNTSHYQRIQQLGYPLTLSNWR
jgi:tRNA(fMet)-specific endonuclease VapC